MEHYTALNVTLTDSPAHYSALHLVSLLLSVGGVALLLAGRGHYTIDVVVAYYVTTRLWCLYHLLLTQQQQQQLQPQPGLELWWSPAARYFEANVLHPLPEEYSLPIPVFLRKKMNKMLH